MKITFEISRPDAIDLLRLLEKELRPELITIDRAGLLAKRAIDFPWPNSINSKARVTRILESNTDITVEALCRMKKSEVIKIKFWGGGVVGYIERALAARGLKLGMTNEEIETYRGS